MTKINVNDVACFFIDWANKCEEEHMTNLWLNKLLFFAQGQYLARFGKPLFDEPVEAWEYGPVVSSIYKKYRVCGRNPISEVDDGYSIDKFSREQQLFLADILRVYGSYTAGALVSMTHRPKTPWHEAYIEGCNVEIEKSAMEAFFKRPENMMKSFEQVLATKQFDVIGWRDNDGYLVLPRDEDEDEWDDL